MTRAPVTLDRALGWRDVAAVAAGSPLKLSDAAVARLDAARGRVETIVAHSIRAYGVNTGVGALCDVVVGPAEQRMLSRNIVMSHAVGVGPALGPAETRAIMAAAVNNWAHGYSGVRPALAGLMLDLLARDCLPVVPSRGSVGYLSHMAHVGLVLIGEGVARHGGRSLKAREALRGAGLAPLVLEAKEGLSIVNGSPCATGLACLAIGRATNLLEWADAAAAMSFEALGGNPRCFDADVMALHRSTGLQRTADRLRALLAGRGDESRPDRTQDALSLRAVPQVHGAARDALDYAAAAVDRELASPTDNPLLLDSGGEPRAASAAHAVAAGIGLAMDLVAIAVAEIASMAERRIDRLANPLVSGLPPFLARDGGTRSGFMIAQYTAASLVAENRRLAAPASLDGGVTSALQEDHLSHATPASLKALAVLDNVAQVIGIEWLMATQAGEMAPWRPAPGTAALAARLRVRVPPYDDDRPLGDDMGVAAALVSAGPP